MMRPDAWDDGRAPIANFEINYKKIQGEIRLGVAYGLGVLVESIIWLFAPGPKSLVGTIWILLIRVMLFGFVVITCILLSQEFKRLKRRNGLRIYRDGFLLPRIENYSSLKYPVHIGYQDIWAMRFNPGKERGRTVRDHGVSLGRDPIAHWGLETTGLFDPLNEFLPDKVTEVTVLVKGGAAWKEYSFGSDELIEGERGLRTLVMAVLIARGKKFRVRPDALPAPAYEPGIATPRADRPVPNPVPRPAYHKPGPLPEPKFEKRGLVPPPVYERGNK